MSESRSSRTGSGFEKKGGHLSNPRPLAKLPKAPAGPAPGGARPTPPRQTAPPADKW